jgi:fatty acid elongase 3
MDLPDLLRSIQDYAATFRWTPGVTPFSTFYAPLIASIIYIIGINVLPRLMEKRPPVKFTFLLAFHNLFLSGASLVMLCAIIYYLIPIYQKEGNEGILCDSQNRLSKGNHVFWYYLFYLSKYYEFFDTLFQILKKRKLIFLHTYHHVITLWLVFFTLTYEFSVQWCDITANALVHTFMYYYYYLTERGKRVWWKKHITKLQIIQFVIDITSHMAWYYYNATTPGGCTGPVWVFHFANFVIGSFLLLFIQFYIGSYKRQVPREKAAENVGDQIADKKAL